MASRTLSPRASEKRRIKLFIRVTPDENDLIRSNADEFADGNLSRWMRNRGMLADLSNSLAMADREKKIE